MQVEEICHTIDDEINKTARIFLATWNLQKEAPELGQWQNLINYLVAKEEEEETQAHESAVSIFMTRIKEKEQEISDIS